MAEQPPKPITSADIERVAGETREVLIAAMRAEGARYGDMSHLLIVVLVLVSATILRVRNELDTATLSTVYGAALGYASGLTTGRRSAGSRSNGR